MANDYKIGYRKPPLGTRFKKGRSGNPRGRPRGSKNLKTDLSEELQEKIMVTEGGRRRSVSKQRAILKSLFAKAMKGDVRAGQAIVSMVERLLLPDASETEAQHLDECDQEILERLLTGQQAGLRAGDDNET